MNKQGASVSEYSAVVLEEEKTQSLTELCRHFAVQTEWIVSLVEEGILDPIGRRPGEWRFSGESCRRVGVVLRLERDLDVNLSGVALVLDLLEEVDALRVRLQTRTL